MLDERHSAGDLARHEFMPPPRRLVVEENPGAAVQGIRLAIVPDKFIARDLAYAIRRTRAERRGLLLWSFDDFSKHFACAREIHSGVGRHGMHCLQHMVSSVNIRVERRKRSAS